MKAFTSVFLLSASFVFAPFSVALLFASDVKPDVVFARNGIEVTVPDGKRWILKKESLQTNSAKLYVKGVFYLSNDVVAQVTPPTDLAPSGSALWGDRKNDEVEMDIPNGSEYDIYFLGGAQIRVETNAESVAFSEFAPD